MREVLKGYTDLFWVRRGARVRRLIIEDRLHEDGARPQPHLAKAVATGTPRPRPRSANSLPPVKRHAHGLVLLPYRTHGTSCNMVLACHERAECAISDPRRSATREHQPTLDGRLVLSFDSPRGRCCGKINLSD
jgi:hypothetical protein